jgi:hypothetical protein
MAESTSQKRLSVLASQICAASTPKGSNFNEVVICAATRTPICKVNLGLAILIGWCTQTRDCDHERQAKRGAFKDASPEDFLVPVCEPLTTLLHPLLN